MLDQITPVILTRDEEPNIGRTLHQLGWARDIVVVDSCSSDRTVDIAQAYPNVRIFEHVFEDLASQWTYAVGKVRTAWFMALDADYFVPAALIEEIRSLDTPPDTVTGYRVRFLYAVNGIPLRASLYPPHIVLARKEAATFVQDGHAQRLFSSGRTVELETPIIHDDRKSFGAFVRRQRKYARQEAMKLRSTPTSALPLSGRIRKLVILAPLAVLYHTLVRQRLILDGRAGLRYVTERFIAEIILSAALINAVLAPSRCPVENAKEPDSTRSRQL